LVQDLKVDEIRIMTLCAAVLVTIAFMT